MKFKRLACATTVSGSPVFQGRILLVVILLLLSVISPRALAQASWTSWAGFPPIPSAAAYEIHVARYADGKLVVFVIGTDGALYRSDQLFILDGNAQRLCTTGWENEKWSAWQKSILPAGLGLRQPFPSFARFGVGTNEDGRVEVFAAGSDGRLWHSWQTAPSGTWSEWSAFDNPPSTGWSIGNIEVGSNADGRLEVFVKNVFNGSLYHTWQGVVNGGWSGAWQNLGGPNAGEIDDFVVGRNADGRLEVFARGASDRGWSISQLDPNSGWGSWLSLPGTSSEALSSPIGAVQNQDGRLEAFFDTPNKVWHTWQSDPGEWSGSWNLLGSPPAHSESMTATRLASGRMAVFAAVPNSGLWQISQSEINNGWADWSLVNRQFDILEGYHRPASAITDDGRTELFILGKGNRIWRTSEDTPQFVIAPGLGPNTQPPSILQLVADSGTSPYVNPSQVPPSAGLDVARVCSGQWLHGYNPAYQWMPILQGGQLEAQEVAVAGWAFGVHPAGDDVWFTHPFDKDFNYDVVPDPAYQGTIASRHQCDGDRSNAVEEAQRAGMAASDALHVEIDGGFVPLFLAEQSRSQPTSFAAHNGDRVVVVGRWVADCGHDDYHSEIHPPLIAAVARSTTKDATHFFIYSRPFLVDQEFGDGALYEHILKQVAAAALTGIPGSYRMKVHPRVMEVPFSGVQKFNFVIRPPTKRRSPRDQLDVSYSLNVRPGISVSFHPSGDDGIRMEVVMNAGQYVKALLPPEEIYVLSKGEIGRAEEGAELLFDAIQANAGINAAANLELGVETHRYKMPVLVEAPPRKMSAQDLYSVQVQPSTAVPWPIVGHIDLSWRREVIGITNVIRAPVIVNVPANVKWIATSVTLKQGQHFSISAEGTWSNSGPPSVGPKGFENYKYPGTLLASADLASLIGKVGDSIFAVGNQFDGTSPADGELFLSINDTAETFSDNQGTLKATISID